MRPSLDDQLKALGISVESLRARGLRRFESATELQVAEVGSDGREHCLIPPAAKAWMELKRRALADGETLFIVSAFRGVERQMEIVRRKLESGESIEHILTVCAPPGYSEHHTGRAIDITTPGSPAAEEQFESTPAFAWLQAHAPAHGFRLSYPRGNPHGVIYEPWHWMHVPG